VKGSRKKVKKVDEVKRLEGELKKNRADVLPYRMRLDKLEKWLVKLPSALLVSNSILSQPKKEE
jgi:hypothetical protein